MGLSRNVAFLGKRLRSYSDSIPTWRGGWREEGRRPWPGTWTGATAPNLASSWFLPQLIPGPSSGRAWRGPGSPWRPPGPGWRRTFRGGLLSVLRPAGGSHGLRALTCFRHPGQSPRRRGRSAARSLALTSATTKAAWREPPPDFIISNSGTRGGAGGRAHLCYGACSLAEPA